MNRVLILILLSFSLLVSNNEIPQNVLKIIPKGYKVLNFTKGDLNRDKFSDAILILKHKGEESEENEYKRPLYILIGNEKGGYKVVEKSDNVVLGYNDGGVFGDPFEGVTIKKGNFSIEHYGGSNWRWSKIVTFKYDKNKKDWFLYRDGEETYHTSKPSKVSREIQTIKDFGVVSFKKYNIFEETE
jgi:hypothetical protein